MTDDEEAQLRKAAEEAGFDPDRYIAVAKKAEAASAKDEPDGDEPTTGKGAAGKGGTATKDLPPIYDYEAPYVYVREIRARKGLTEKFDGDDYIAADWKRLHPSEGAAEPPAPAAKKPGEE